MIPNAQLLSVNLALIQAIQEKDKEGIIKAFIDASTINMDYADLELLEEYESLVEQANDILDS